MVKKKPEVSRRVIEVEASETAPPETGEEAQTEETKTVKTVETAENPVSQLVRVLDGIEKRQAAQDQKIDALAGALNSMVKAVEQRTQQRAQVQEQQEQPKGTNYMEIFKSIMDALNSPLVKGITDKLLGGGEEEAAASAVPTISPEEAKYIMEQRKRQDDFFGRYQEAIIKGLELGNDVKKRELESEF